MASANLFTEDQVIEKMFGPLSAKLNEVAGQQAAILKALASVSVGVAQVIVLENQILAMVQPPPATSLVIKFGTRGTPGPPKWPWTRQNECGQSNQELPPDKRLPKGKAP